MIRYRLMRLSADGIVCPNFLPFLLILENISSLLWSRAFRWNDTVRLTRAVKLCFYDSVFSFSDSCSALPNTHTHTHKRTQTKHKLISTHTMSLHTHSSNHSSNLPLHKSMCSINTHICIQYMATCNLHHLWGTNMDMYNSGSCSAGANGRGLQISDGRKSAFTDFYFKAFVPSFVPTKHDRGWTSVLIRTRGLPETPVRGGHC